MYLYINTLYLVIFLSFSIGAFVFLSDTSSSVHRRFTTMCLIGSLWTYSNLMTEIDGHQIWFRFSYSIGGLLLFVGLLWIYAIIDRRINKYLLLILPFLITIPWIPDFINENYTGLSLDKSLPISLILYSILCILLFCITLKGAFMYMKQKNRIGKTLMTALIITFSTSTISSFLFPYLSIYTSGVVDSIGFLFFILIISYTILKIKMIPFKIYNVQVAIVLIWSTLYLRLFLADNGLQIILDLIFFVISILIGWLISQTIRHNIDHRTNLDQLSKKLTEYPHHLP